MNEANNETPEQEEQQVPMTPEEMAQAREQFMIAMAYQIYKVAYLTGDFTLRSGQKSNEYFDKYMIETNPGMLQDICSLISESIIITEKIENKPHMVAGLETGGIPIATVLSCGFMIPYVIVRKETKTYGTCKLAEGLDVKGRTLLIIEDVVTTGGQIIKSVKDLRNLGATVYDCICVIDREQGGKEALEKEGIKLHSLFTMSFIKETYTKISAELAARNKSGIITP